MKILTHVNMAPIESSEVLMRGLQDKQTSMWAFVSIEERIPIEHPLRRIKKLSDQQLVKLSGVFNQMYSQVGRPSIAPERVLKSLLLMALYSVRSERQLCEQLGYNLLFRWFLDMELEEESFDATVFSKNRERLLEHEVGRLFFEAVVKQAREANLISDDHFSVDGTLIEAWVGTPAQPLTTQNEEPMSAKYIFVTGGVVSSLGKGLAAASIGCLLESRGLKVNMMKFDPYLN